jgi:glutamate/tyrosine decarboxylase-like PLP-dependent enzyme
MATDAHKWLNVTYDSGIVLLRTPSTSAAVSPLSPTIFRQRSDTAPARPHAGPRLIQAAGN